MKTYPNKSILQRIHLLFTYTLFALPILPKIVSNITIGIFVGLSLLISLTNKQKVFRVNYFIATAAIYFVLLASLFYSSNSEYALKKLGTLTPLLLLPLSFAVVPSVVIEYLRNHLKDFLKVYVASIIVLVLISLFMMLSNYDLDIILQGKRSFLHQLGLWNNIDSLYLSYHLSIATLVTGYLFFISKKSWKALGGSLVFIFLFSVLLYFSFKASIMAFLLGIAMLTILINQRKLWILFSGLFVCILGLIVFVPSINSRFSELLIVKNPEHKTLESVTIRNTINECSFEIMPHASLFGYGIGDSKQELLDCFASKESALFDLSYNTHNQYLSLILAVGFIGLLVFFLSYGYLGIQSLNKKNYLAVALLFLFAVWMLAENILERQEGVFYFSLFLNFLFVLNFNASTSAGSLVLSHEKVIDTFEKDNR